jgi:hypothetical protein
MKNVIVGIVSKYKTTTRSDLKEYSELMLQRGRYNITHDTAAIANAGKTLNKPLSEFEGIMPSFPINFIKSANG